MLLRLLRTVGTVLNLLLTSSQVPEFARVLGPDGELQRLTAPAEQPTLIRAKSLTKVTNFRRVMLAFQLPVVVIGVVMALAAIYVGPVHCGFCRWWSMFLMMFVLGIWLLTVGMFILDFLFSLEVAAALVTDAVEDIIEAALAVSPLSDDWQAKVVRPALQLARGVMSALSGGWSRGLSIVFIGCWLLTVAVFGAALSMANGSARSGDNLAKGVVQILIVILIDVMILFLPLQMSRCVAQVSSSCDDLMNTLNERRLDDLGSSEQLLALELALKNLHNGQGLGFIIGGGVVLDRRRLRNMFFSVASVFATLAPIIFSISLTTTDDHNAAMYGALPGNSSIYALSNHHRTYPESVAFCQSLWMRPASISSQAENDALVRLIHKVGLNYGENFWQLDSVFVGARRRGSSAAVGTACITWPDECAAATHWEWEDGSEMQWFHAGFEERALLRMTESDMAQDDRITLSVQTPLCEEDDERCQLEHPWYYEGMKFAIPFGVGPQSGIFGRIPHSRW